MSPSPFHLFGVRHHGPGCARSLLKALETLNPDCILIEGPPDAESVLPLIVAAGMQPPVALLIYNPDNSKQASLYPFAEFSPEWQALQFGIARDVPPRFMDLPIAHQFALEPQGETPPEADTNDETPIASETGALNDERVHDTSCYPSDPLDWLAKAAGHSDGESWWNYQIEERIDGLELFSAIREAMTSVRELAPSRTTSPFAQRREALREAYMRKTMRQAQKDGFERIAVICGAWHLPALENLPTAKADNELLKALPKTKVAATWVPWSYRHLSVQSGYGAGVESPAWYEYLWKLEDKQHRSIHWLAKAARLMRGADIDCSSAHVIEAVRLADGLAALRDKPQAGLDELMEAMRSLVCMGEDGPLQLLHDQLIIGDKLGAIPEDTPLLPLQRDLEQQQKSLRLKPDVTQKNLDLDLRQPNDLARSHLLHRLNLLDIRWASINRTGRSAKGSFHEIWSIQWQPALALAIIDASRWGNSVETAASGKAIEKAATSKHLHQLSDLIQQVLLADLRAALPAVAQSLENLSAVTSDLEQLLLAIPPLSQVARYGNVRNTQTAMVEDLLDSLVPRAAIALPGACSSLDDEAAARLREQVVGAHQAVRLLERESLNEGWFLALRQIALGQGYQGLMAGLATRLLFDSQQIDNDETARLMGLTLSRANDPNTTAAWVEGFLNASGMVLLHDNRLWTLVDHWLTTLTPDHFTAVLPLLRRTFATFSTPERRQLGERASRGNTSAASAATVALDMQRTERTIPLLRQLMGLTP